jgi:hypothetical protein
MRAGKVGRDHLGLGSVSSDQILPSLSPSINVLTFHPRYHSFYVFLLDEFWQRDLSRTQAAWVEFFRPPDFIYSLGANLCDRPEHGQMGNIVGGRKTGPLASQRKDEYSYDPDYIVNELGGYGLYYRTVMAEAGLIYPGGTGFFYPVDVPSEYGKEVASAFRKDIQSTRYYQKYFDQNIPVPISVIEEFIREACLCQLQKSDANDRQFIRETFLYRGTSIAAKARRATFRFFLDLANQTKGYGLDEDAFRQLIYFGSTPDGLSFSPDRNVKDTAVRWRYYQAREYYAFALNALWYYLCDWGVKNNGDIRSIPLSSFWQHLDQALDFTQFARRLGLANPGLQSVSGFRDLLNWIRSVAEDAGQDFDNACGITCPLHEHRIYRLAQEYRQQPDVMTSGMITLLALVLLRFGSPDLRIQPEWEIARMGGDTRLSLDRFIRKLQANLQSGPVTIIEVLRSLYESDIVLQHELVATSKLPENTFRFNREGEGLRFHNLPNSLEFMNSRFDAIRTTIHELGLCGDLSQPNHALTHDGMNLLKLGDL